jgi:hypothetical protein
MKLVGKRIMERRNLLLIVPPPPIVIGIGSKMQRTAHNVVPTLLVLVIVAAGLYDVDLARRRPHAVRVVHRQHPNGRPQPVARGQLGRDLDAAEFDRGAALGVNTTGFDWVDDGAVGRVGVGEAIEKIGARAAFPTKVNGGILFDEGFVLQGGLDPKHVVFDEHVFVIVGCPFELAISKERLVYMKWGTEIGQKNLV